MSSRINRVIRRNKRRRAEAARTMDFKRQVYEYRVDDMVYGIPTEAINKRDNNKLGGIHLGELARFQGKTTTELMQMFYFIFEKRLTFTIIDFDGTSWKRVIIDDIINEKGIKKVLISRGKKV